MSKELVVSSDGHETRLAILEDDRLVEIYVEREANHAIAGSIYKGRVSRVLPGMQSAFVKLGLARDAFLYVSDVLDQTAEIEAGDDPDLAEGAGEGRSSERKNGSDGGRRRRGGRNRRRRGGRGREEHAAESDEPREENAEAEVDASEESELSPDSEGRRGRRGRRRRGRRSESEPQSERETREEPASDEADRDSGGFAVLPGESLAKYSSRADHEDIEQGADSSEAKDDENQDPDEDLTYLTADDAIAEDESDSTESDDGSDDDLDDDIEFDDEVEDDDEESDEQDDEDVGDGKDDEDEEGVESEEDNSDEEDSTDSDADGEEAEEPDGGDELAEDDDSDEDELDDEGSSEDIDYDEQGEDEPAQSFVAESDDQADDDAPGSDEAQLAREMPGQPEEGAVDGAEAEGAEAALKASDESSRFQRRGRRGRRRRRGGRGRDSRDQADETPDAQPDADADKTASARPEPGDGVPNIKDLLEPGQELVVQIAKEPLGKKGARITSHIALPGRFMVYMPTVDHNGVSRKIHSDAERARLRRIVKAHSEGKPGGFIVRTAGRNADEDELKADLDFLYNQWQGILEKADRRKAPALLYHDLDVVERVMRDQLGQNYKTIWVDNEDKYERILRFVERFQPDLIERVKLYTRSMPIFDEFNITQEIEKALRPKVWLKSGGYLVINQTEALVAIDVNTGKYVGKSDRLEDTIFKTNLEAAEEVVRQARLRDLGGIIVVDFIDMEDRKNRTKVHQELEGALRRDRAPAKALQFNDFGLVAITRKRVKQSLERALCAPCPTCSGSGTVKSVPTVVSEILREAHKRVAEESDTRDVTVRVHPDVAKVLKARSNTYLQELEETLGANVVVRGIAGQHPDQYSFH